MAEPRDNICSLTNERVATLTGATADAIAHTLRRRLSGRPVVNEDQHLRALLVATMADLDHEQLRVLFLDRGNRLLADEIVSRGTVSRLTIYPRMVLRRAIALNATALILVHNHPGGQADPSSDDIEGTRRIVALAAALDITVQDHLIVAAGNVGSMRARGLL